MWCGDETDIIHVKRPARTRYLLNNVHGGIINKLLKRRGAGTKERGGRNRQRRMGCEWGKGHIWHSHVEDGTVS
jgi:hypothetical protein